MNKKDEVTLSTEEAAKYLGISERTLRRWTADGQLARGSVHTLKGIENRYNLSDLDKLKEKPKVAGGQGGGQMAVSLSGVDSPKEDAQKGQLVVAGLFKKQLDDLRRVERRSGLKTGLLFALIPLLILTIGVSTILFYKGKDIFAKQKKDFKLELETRGEEFRQQLETKDSQIKALAENFDMLNQLYLEELKKLKEKIDPLSPQEEQSLSAPDFF